MLNIFSFGIERKCHAECYSKYKKIADVACSSHGIPGVVLLCVQQRIDVMPHRLYPGICLFLLHHSMLMPVGSGSCR